MPASESLNGPFTNIGNPVDQYNAALVYTDLATERVTFSSSGTKYFKFTVTGKNAASSNYWIVPDSFTFVPVDHALGATQDWRYRYFGTTEDSGDAADLADPDSDGFSNLMEYATGSYPTGANGSVWKSAMAGEHLALTFPRLRDATDVIYQVMASNDLGTETEIWSSATVPYPGGSAESVMTTVTDPQSTTANASRFLRLKITRP